MTGSLLNIRSCGRGGIRGDIPVAIAPATSKTRETPLSHRKRRPSRSSSPLIGAAAALFVRWDFVILFVLHFSGSAVFAQESPYIVTYDHHLEEPGNLEVEYFSTFGTQRARNDFHAYWMEFEYGATAWWTTEFYLDAQTTFHDSTLFTGFRWENRFRPLRTEHLINPVIYVEYENISEADKTIKEVEGHDVESDHAPSNSVLRQSHDHELEFKLILSKDFKGWNFAVNPLATKNLLPNNPWEFGYAVGISRPLALKASAKHCTFCRENFIAGMELYGGVPGELRNARENRASALLRTWPRPSRTLG
jgi:hypothetical protein